MPMPHPCGTIGTMDQYYTPKDVSRRCLKSMRVVCQVSLSDPSLLWIEPAAGDGAFSDYLPKDQRVAIDTDPKRPYIEKADFFDWKPPSFPHHKRLVIGNPPFGSRGKLAARFVNRALNIAPVVGMIMPMIFSDYYGQRMIFHNASLSLSKRLLGVDFRLPSGRTKKMNVLFQVWTAGAQFYDYRVTEPPPTTHPDFEIYQYNNTEASRHLLEKKFDFAVPCQGYQDYNRLVADPDELDPRKQWLLFDALGNNDTFVNLCHLNYHRMAHTSQTVQPGFRKWHVIREYQRTYG